MSSASSASVASAALVRRMKPPPIASPPSAARAATSACTSAAMRARSCSRSSGEPIFCEMPMWSSCGRKTSSRPAIEICVDKPRALGADRVLDHLHRQRLALEDDALDRRRRHRARRMVAARRSAVDEHVGDVQEGGALEADLDERRLHPGQDARDLADVDVADAAALELALEVQLLHRAVLDDGDAGFLRRPVDQDVLHRLPRAGSSAGARAGHRRPPTRAARPSRAAAVP